MFARWRGDKHLSISVMGRPLAASQPGQRSLRKSVDSSLAHRQFPRPEGGAAAVSELLELPLTFTVDLYEATVEDISFTFPKDYVWEASG